MTATVKPTLSSNSRYQESCWLIMCLSLEVTMQKKTFVVTPTTTPAYITKPESFICVASCSSVASEIAMVQLKLMGKKETLSGSHVRRGILSTGRKFTEVLARRADRPSDFSRAASDQGFSWLTSGRHLEQLVD